MLWELVLWSALGAGDWPQFRGPNADGNANHVQVPLEWSETHHVAWNVDVPGLGWSSPAIAEGKLFLTTAVSVGSGLSLRALALDPATGAVLWNREVRALDEAPGIHPKNSHASPTPLVHEGSVYVHFGALGMARLSTAEGAILWRCTELEYPPVHGSGGSPILHEGRLIVVCDGSQGPYVAAVEAPTGRVAWRTPRSVAAKINHSFVTPTIAIVEGRAQVLAPGPDHMAAYDVATGAELWKVVAPGWSVVPQPAIGHGLVIYNHDYDHPELLAVKLGGSGDLTESHVVWRLKRGAPSTPSPLLVGDELYIVSDKGIASCVDARTGEVHWTERLGGNYSASPSLVSGRILFLDEDGKSTWVRPGTTFEILGMNQLSGRTLATPAFHNDAMYLRTDTRLYKIAE
jgi:outer membrane protein assembly factor BamB